MKEQTKFSGSIQFISSSPHGEVEGIVLDDGSFIKLPPHSVLKPDQIAIGAKVSGTGDRITLRPNPVYHHVILKMGALTLADDQAEKGGPKHRKALEKVSRITGKLVSIGTRPKGEVDRMILDDGTSIHLSKELELFADDMRIGQSYEITGDLRSFDKLTYLKAESVQVLA